MKAIQREKGGPTEAQGLWGTYERDEADQMEPIKADRLLWPRQVRVKTEKVSYCLQLSLSSQR